MKTGDLVKIRKKFHRTGGYGIVIALHWSGDTSMVSVILAGDISAYPFYKYELEVINGNKR